MQNMQNMQDIQNMQKMQNMQNMQNIQNMQNMQIGYKAVNALVRSAFGNVLVVSIATNFGHALGEVFVPFQIILKKIFRVKFRCCVFGTGEVLPHLARNCCIYNNFCPYLVNAQP